MAVTDALAPVNAKLVRQIARRYRKNDLTVDPNEIIITVGATEAINLCLQADAKPDDVIAVASPTFYAMPHAIERTGMKTINVSRRSNNWPWPSAAAGFSAMTVTPTFDRAQKGTARQRPADPVRERQVLPDRGAVKPQSLGIERPQHARVGAVEVQLVADAVLDDRVVLCGRVLQAPAYARRQLGMTPA